MRGMCQVCWLLLVAIAWRLNVIGTLKNKLSGTIYIPVIMYYLVLVLVLDSLDSGLRPSDKRRYSIQRSFGHYYVFSGHSVLRLLFIQTSNVKHQLQKRE